MLLLHLSLHGRPKSKGGIRSAGSKKIQNKNMEQDEVFKINKLTDFQKLVIAKAHIKKLRIEVGILTSEKDEMVYHSQAGKKIKELEDKIDLLNYALSDLKKNHKRELDELTSGFTVSEKAILRAVKKEKAYQELLAEINNLKSQNSKMTEKLRAEISKNCKARRELSEQILELKQIKKP